MSQRFARVVRFLVSVRTAWSLLGITLFLIICVEGGLRLFFLIKDRSLMPAYSDPRLVSEGYGNAPWVAGSFDEFARVEPKWQSYVYFRQKAFRGQYVNVDEKGIRATWEPPSSTGDESKQRVEIMVFGGSTIWGVGARDEGTIPSLVARDLADRGIDGRVKNLGEVGYVSSQEVIALMRELQNGARPDVVVFYDGVNDTTSAILDRSAGIPENEGNRRAEFNVRRKPLRLLGLFVAAVIKDSASFRLAQSLLGRLRGVVNTPGPPIALPPLTGSGEKVLVKEVVHWYVENVRVVEMLGREYGFEPLFYWQPVLFTKRNRGSFENEERYKYSWGESIFLDVYKQIETEPELESNERWHNISQIFGDSPDLLYTDYCHLTERGNAVIAKRIADDVAAIAGAKKGDPAESAKPRN